MTSNGSTPVVVVFGATGGIGSALRRRLVSRGWSVMAVGRDPVKLEKLQSEHDLAVHTLTGMTREAFAAAIHAVSSRYGHLTGTVNCIGSLLIKPAHMTTEEEWAATIQANLTSAFYTVHTAARSLTSGGGSIVLASSAAARVGLAHHEAMAAAKAGVIGLTLAAAGTYAPRGVRVNCVAPGLVRTPLTARITGNASALDYSTSLHAMGRIGEASDVAAAMEWLLDPSQGWVTGQVLGVDGGLGSVVARRVGG